MKTDLLVACSLMLVSMTLGGLNGCTPTSQNDSSLTYPESTVSGDLESDWQKTTISELESLLGQQLPVPTYLPTDYEIKEVYYSQELPTKPEPIINIIFLISDQQVCWSDKDYTCRIVFSIFWNSPGFGLKLPDAEYITDIQGRLEEKDNEYILRWGSYGSPKSFGSTLRLRASQNLPKDELIKIAVSTP